MPNKFNKQNILVALLLVDAFIVGFAGVVFFSGILKKLPRNVAKEVQTRKILEAKPEDITSQKGIFNAVLLGSGGAGHDGGGLTDSIIVAHIDTNTKKAALISVPRDLWVPGNHKLNGAAFNNGLSSVPATLANITGLEMDYYISVDFGNFVKIIDELDGIRVDVPKSFQDNFYPIKGEENNTCGFSESEIFEFKNQYSGFNLEKQFTCRYEQLKFTQGPADLNGTTALKFVRSRHGDSDFGRSERQFAVLKGMAGKLVSLNALNNASSILNALFDMVKTDITPGAVKSVLEVLGDTGSYQVTHIQLTTDNVLNESKSTDGQYILVPKSGNFNFTEIKNLVNSRI